MYRPSSVAGFQCSKSREYAKSKNPKSRDYCIPFKFSKIHFFKLIGRLISIAIFLQCCLPEDCMSGSIISEVSLFLTSWNWTSFSSLYFISFNIETHTHSMEQMESVVKLLQICCYAAADFFSNKIQMVVAQPMSATLPFNTVFFVCSWQNWRKLFMSAIVFYNTIIRGNTITPKRKLFDQFFA